MRFHDIPAHETIKQRLRNLADSNRLPHALLLEGPAGSYKLALARAFAQYIHCTSPTPDGDACGRCPSCLQHQSLNHIDTLFVFPVVKTEAFKEPVSNDYFEQWRRFLDESPTADFALWTRLLEKKNAKPVIYVHESNALSHALSLTGHDARFRVILFWLPEKLNVEAANKLLKLIEEPHADTVFLMVSDNPAEILPTIYSRTQRIEVPRLSDDTVARVLTERHGVDPQEALAVAHITEGNINAALDRLGLSSDNERLFDLFVQLMRLAYQRKVGDLKAWGASLSEAGRDFEMRFYANAERLVRENFMYNFHIPQLLYMTRDEEAFSTNFARFITEENAERLMRLFGRARTDIAGNANDKIVNFDVALKVCFLLKH